MRHGNLDYCLGCAVPPDERVNLPDNWQEGDDKPANLTYHSTDREPQRFAFRGHPSHQRRVYFTKDGDYDYTG